MTVPPVVPALPDTVRLTSYAISAQTGPFAVNFALYGDGTDYGNWIQVWLNDTLLTAVTNYTLSSPTGPIGSISLPITDAQITLTASSTGTLVIVGARRPRRVTQFAENRGVAARDLNQAITDDVADLRENWDFVRTRTLVLGGIAPTTNVLPAAAARANTTLTFDAGGNPLLQPTTSGGGGTTTVPAPGDALTTAFVTPVAAHSMARKLFASFTGKLFQVRRVSDNAVLDIGTLANGYADVPSLTSFLTGTTGAVVQIYDQTGNNNYLPQATNINQGTLNIRHTTNGIPVPVVSISAGNFYRNRSATIKIPTGTQPTTQYMVVTNHNNAIGNGIGTYGNVENTVADHGTGHMFSLVCNTGNAVGGSGAGSGPWPGVDFENGLDYGAGGSFSITSDFSVVLAKVQTGSPQYVLKGGPATTTQVNLAYSGNLPAFVSGAGGMALEGGISLGEGGDGAYGPIEWVEGIICAGFTADADDQKLQNNLAQTFGTTGWDQDLDGLSTAQRLRLYNPNTSFSVSYASEYAALSWTLQSNVFSIGTLAEASGTVRDIAIGVQGQSRLWVYDNPSEGNANRFAFENGTTAVGLRIYNTVNDPQNPTNYERGVIGWVDLSNVFVFGSGQSGSGSARPVAFLTGGTEGLRLDTSQQLIGTPGSTTPATLTVNGQYTLTPTSNTNFRISYRGSDGVTRVGNITLA